MGHLLNTRDALVADAIEGELRAAGGRLARLDGYPDIRVVLRADWDRSKVAVVSGGGAGHEPAHAGFVGRGMLAAAVSGDVFASPGVDAVLAAITAVAGPPGVLLVVKNYTGDRLNFGLAAEKARALGIAVETVIVGDDIALPGIAQPRGIAGTLLVHKIAGHAAEAGRDLAAVAAVARGVAADARSIGMALSTCTVPGRGSDGGSDGRAEARIGEGEAELGLGIHGEPGAERGPLGTAREAVATMLGRLGATAGGEPLALLVNNLGGLPPVELAVATEAALAALGDRVALLVGPAPLMTSLDMKGFSLSVLPLDAERREAILAPVEPRAWPGVTVPGTPPVLPLPDAARIVPATGGGGAGDRLAREAAAVVLRALIEQEAALNRLDGAVGDGDTGSTVARTARTLLGELDALVAADWGGTLLAVADRIGATMGGSSGVIASIFLAAAGGALRNGETWPGALRAGFERVSFHGGAREGDRTMLDALGPAIRSLEAGGDLRDAAQAAEAGAAATAEITRTGSGRSSYLREDVLRGVPDPGAVAVAAAWAALADGAGTASGGIASGGTASCGAASGEPPFDGTAFGQETPVGVP